MSSELLKRVSKELLSVAQVAAKWGVSTSYVARQIRQGKLPAVQVGRGYLVARVDAEKREP